MSDIISFFLSILFAINSLLGVSMFKPVKIVTEPAVFEVGNGNYCVMWETNREATGYVTVTKDGEEYVFYDSDYGIIRTDDTVHSVKLPKSVLDGATYTCSSQYVFRQYAYLVNKGPVASTQAVDFVGYHGQEGFKALVLSDVHAKWGYVRDAVKNFGEPQWDILLLNGDIPNTLMNKDEFTDNILAGAREFTCGRIPVVFARGNHEAMGAYSPEIARYFKTEQPGLYYTFNYGNVDFTVLDAGADDEDSAEKFNGLIDFETYCAEEGRWLKGLEKNDNGNLQVCICHQQHLSRYEEWTPELNRLGTKLLVCGHWHLLNDNVKKTDAEFRTVITGGKENAVENSYIATLLTFNADNTVDMLSYDNAGVCRYNDRIV